MGNRIDPRARGARDELDGGKLVTGADGVALRLACAERAAANWPTRASRSAVAPAMTAWRHAHRSAPKDGGIGALG